MVRSIDLHALGELGLVELVRRRAGPVRRGWRIGIGDDCAVLRPQTGCELAWTVDALVEGVHFREAKTDAVSLGHKALAVNVSDLNAMGARPLGFLLALGLPEDASGERIDGFLRGLLAEGRRSGCLLVGGDTVRAPCWMISISAVGELPRGRALRRDGARVGDRILVTGELGAAALGLHLLEAGADVCAASGLTSAVQRRFVRLHRRPRPAYGAGERLLRSGWATAAMDISDGLALDLPRLLRASGVGAEVWLDRLALARGLRAAAGAFGLDPLELAASGGEDYGLLFCARRDAPGDTALSRRLGCRVTTIGEVRAGGTVEWLRDGRRVEPPRPCFEHFKASVNQSEE